MTKVQEDNSFQKFTRFDEAESISDCASLAIIMNNEDFFSDMKKVKSDLKSFQEDVRRFANEICRGQDPSFSTPVADFARIVDKCIIRAFAEIEVLTKYFDDHEAKSRIALGFAFGYRGRQIFEYNINMH